MVPESYLCNWGTVLLSAKAPHKQKKVCNAQKRRDEIVFKRCAGILGAVLLLLAGSRAVAQPQREVLQLRSLRGGRVEAVQTEIHFRWDKSYLARCRNQLGGDHQEDLACQHLRHRFGYAEDHQRPYAGRHRSVDQQHLGKPQCVGQHLLDHHERVGRRAETDHDCSCLRKRYGNRGRELLCTAAGVGK